MLLFIGKVLLIVLAIILLYLAEVLMEAISNLNNAIQDLKNEITIVASFIDSLEAQSQKLQDELAAAGIDNPAIQAAADQINDVVISLKAKIPGPVNSIPAPASGQLGAAPGEQASTTQAGT